MCDLNKLKRYEYVNYEDSWGEYGHVERKNGEWVRFEDVQKLLGKEPFNAHDYDFEINDLKTYDQWRAEDRGILKGSKAVGKNEEGKGLFHKNQTAEIVHRSSYDYDDDIDDQFNGIVRDHVRDLQRDYDPRYWADDGIGGKVPMIPHDREHTGYVFGGPSGGTVWYNEFGEETCPPDNWRDRDRS